MFCKNCGKPMDDIAAVCVNCGVAKGNGNAFCGNCGAPSMQGAAVCTNCGAPVGPAYSAADQKSKMVAGLLGLLLGGWGVHNFYLGYIGKGIAQIFLTFCFGVGYIWGLIEGIMILAGSINTDANGIPLKD